MPCPGGSNYPNNRSPPFELTDDHDAEKYWMLVEGFTLLLAVKWETEWCNQFCLPSNHTPGGKYSFV